MTVRAVYWSSGGEILAWPRTRLSCEDAIALRELYVDEVRAAKNAGDMAALVRASRLEAQIAYAGHLAVRWRRAGGPVGS
jgi:hypothetical protein